MNGNSNLFEVVLKAELVNRPSLERKWITAMLVRMVKNNTSRMFCFILIPVVLKRLYRCQVSVSMALGSYGKGFWEHLLSHVPGRITSGKAWRAFVGEARSGCVVHSEDPSQGVSCGGSEEWGGQLFPTEQGYHMDRC